MKTEVKDDEIIIGVKPKGKQTGKKGAAKAPKDNNGKKRKKNNVRSFEEFRRTSRLRLVKAVFILIVIMGICFFVANLSIFSIKEIEITGNQVVNTDQIKQLTELTKEDNIFRINKSVIINKLKGNSYIDSVTIKRKLPNTLQINIVERTRKYAIKLAESYIYINNQGYILEISTDKLDLPIITGLKTDFSNIHAGNRLIEEDLEELNTIIKIIEVANSNDIGSLISKIDVSNKNNYLLEIESEGKKAYIGDCSNLNTRILNLKFILEQEKGIPGTAFIDMDLNAGRVYFRPD